MADGVVAEIKGIEASYDYWALRTNGDFYFLGSLFEDERAANMLWFDTRLSRVTETLLFCYRLYTALGVPEKSVVHLYIRHGGLNGRVLGSARPAVWHDRKSHEDQVEWARAIELATLRAELPKLVKAALDPLFMVFDFFRPQDQQVNSEVEAFLAAVGRQQTPFEL
jgi:hypothetical protein